MFYREVATVLGMSAAGALALLVHGAPTGTSGEDLLLARWLAAWGDAFLTGMFGASFVAFVPQWLATWADQRYLQPPKR